MNEQAPVLDLHTDADDVLLDLMERMTERVQLGQDVDVEAYVRQYPQYAEQLRKMSLTLEVLRDLAQASVAATEAVDAGQPARTTGSPLTAGALGDYRILREIGRGGMGVVYEAEQVSLGRKVALKVLPFAAMMDRRQLQRFQNEARAAASLKHPNIVQVYAVGCERAVHFYAMEYVEGETLAELIHHLRRRAGLEGEVPADAGPAAANLADSLAAGQFALPRAGSGPDAPTEAYPHDQTPGAAAETARPAPAALSTERSTRSAAYFRSIAEIGVQIAEALDHAHQHGVIHRDVKPSNVILDNEGKPWVTDFGLARIENDATLTVTGDLLGTLRYMSPEQALAKRIVVDHRTDVYSLGITLYELLTLQPAYSGQDRQDLLRQIAFEDPKAPRRVNKAIPEELEIIVTKAMAKNPAERYDTAQELADDLRRFLEDRPIYARRPTFVQRAAKWSRRHKPIVWSAAVSTFLLLGAGLVGLGIGNMIITEERDAKDQALADKTAALKDKNDALLLAEANARRARENESTAVDNAAKAAANYQMARRAVRQMLTRVADEHLEKIPEMNEIRQRLLEDALAFYTELLKLSPKDALAYHERGQLYERLHEINRASADYEKAISLDLENAKFHAALGHLCFNCADEAKVDLRRALLHIEKASRLKPRHAGYHHDLAAIYFFSGERQKSQQAYLRAAELTPSAVFANMFRARACYAVGDFQGALEWEKKSLAIDPDHALVHDHLSWYYSDLGECQEAITAATKAIEGYPRAAGGRWDKWETYLFFPYFVRGDAHARLKMYPQAFEDYSRALELAPFRWDIYKKRALVAFRLKDYDKALADTAQAVELKPHEPSNLACIPLQLVAKCPAERFRRGMLALAEKSIELTKGAAAAYVTRATLYSAFGQPEKALADFSKAIELDPKSPGAWTGRGRFYADQSRWQQALADLEKAVELKPDTANDCDNLARCLATGPDRRLWKPDRAVELAQKAVALAPKEGRQWHQFRQEGMYWNTLGAAQYRAGEWKAAVDALNQAIHLRAGGDTHDWFFLAMAHWQLGNREEAREWYNKAVQWMAENEPVDDEIPRFHSEASGLLNPPDAQAEHTDAVEPAIAEGPRGEDEASRSDKAQEGVLLSQRVLGDLGKDTETKQEAPGAEPKPTDTKTTTSEPSAAEPKSIAKPKEKPD